MFTIGVLADTHIPDRAKSLHPQVLSIFSQAKVSLILHAGDVSCPAVLDQLRQLAPVRAVRGNRDWFQLHSLPVAELVSFQGVQIALTHGYGAWPRYFSEKVLFILQGYRLERYQPRLLSAFPAAQAVVFGHTHCPVNVWVGDQLLFNPGSPHFPMDRKTAPSIGLLHIAAEGGITGEIIALDRSANEISQAL